MHNAHFENDAQNYHIIGIEMVSSHNQSNRYNAVQSIVRTSISQTPTDLYESTVTIVAGQHVAQPHAVYQAH